VVDLHHVPESVFPLACPTIPRCGRQAVKSKARQSLLDQMIVRQAHELEIVGRDIGYAGRILARVGVRAAHRHHGDRERGQGCCNFRIVIVGDDSVALPAEHIVSPAAEVLFYEQIPFNPRRRQVQTNAGDYLPVINLVGIEQKGNALGRRMSFRSQVHSGVVAAQAAN